MDTIAFVVFIGTFISWGLGAFIAKIAASKIGTQSVFWDIIGYVPAVIIYSLIVFRLENILSQFSNDKVGIVLALLAGVVGSFGAVGFYYLMARTDASTAAPLTALYPALTAILAFIFLRETITPSKILGITLSLIAIYLLAR